VGSEKPKGRARRDETIGLEASYDPTNSGIGNVTANTGLVEMPCLFRSRVLCAAARLGVARSLGDEVRSVGFLAEECAADAGALYACCVPSPAWA